MQEAKSQIFHLFLEVTVRVCMDDITLHLRGQREELVERTKCFCTLKEELNKVKLELSHAAKQKKEHVEIPRQCQVLQSLSQYRQSLMESKHGHIVAQSGAASFSPFACVSCLVAMTTRSYGLRELVPTRTVRCTMVRGAGTCGYGTTPPYGKRDALVEEP